MQTKPTRVAIYTGVSKNPTFIERLISGLAARGIDLLVFGADMGKIQHSPRVHYYLYRGKMGKLFTLLKYSLLLFFTKNQEKKKLDAIIKKQTKPLRLLQLKYYPVLYHKPDIFHLQWAKGLQEWAWVKDFGMALVLSLRGAHINYSPLADDALAASYRAWFPKIDRFHAVSKAIALEATKYGASPDRIEVVKSGLNLDSFPFVSKQFDAAKPIKILSIGRTHWKKNYSLALDAMGKLKSKGVDFSYTIIGIDEDEALLFQRDQLQLNSCVFLEKEKPFNKVIEAIYEADILLLPSLEEGIANVVLESMALGTLVISTDCGGMKEVVKNGETGFLVPLQNAESICIAIEKVKRMTPEMYLTITEKARELISHEHTEEYMCQEMINLYLHTIQPHP